MGYMHGPKTEKPPGAWRRRLLQQLRPWKTQAKCADTA
jgi:hypothetical protein